MRTTKEIQNDIQKLNQELQVVKSHESMTKAAVSILKNLGWTHSNLKGWEKPKEPVVKPDLKPKVKWKEFDSDINSPFKSGDIIFSKILGSYYIVRDNIGGGQFQASKVLEAHSTGLVVSPLNTILTVGYVSPATKQEVVTHFKTSKGA